MYTEQARIHTVSDGPGTLCVYTVVTRKSIDVMSDSRRPLYVPHQRLQNFSKHALISGPKNLAKGTSLMTLGMPQWKCDMLARI